MDAIQNETATVERPETIDRPVWQKPEMTEVAVSAVTGCCYALGGNDGTPSVTSVS